MPTIAELYLGDLRVECVHLQSGTKIVTDAPTDNQGRGESFSPTDLCAASLGACAMTIMGIYAKSHGLDVAGTRVEVTKHMAADPRRIGRVEVAFHFPARDFSDKDKTALERAARACPVSLSLGENVIQEFSFNWQN